MDNKSHAHGQLFIAGQTNLPPPVVGGKLLPPPVVGGSGPREAGAGSGSHRQWGAHAAGTRVAGQQPGEQPSSREALIYIPLYTAHYFS